jgi:hypothetical protein
MLPYVSRPKRGRFPANMQPAEGPPRSLGFPHCQVQQGICDTLLTSLPFAIFGLQFVRDEADAVQDGIIIFSNARADAFFGRKLPNGLKGAMFLSSLGDYLPFGAWQRMLWIAACDKSEIIHLAPINGKDGNILVAAPYRDGLIISRSMTETTEA